MKLYAPEYYKNFVCIADKYSHSCCVGREIDIDEETADSLALGNGAERAKKIVEEYKPLFATKEEYLAYVDALSSSGDRIVYNDDGTANVKTN